MLSLFQNIWIPLASTVFCLDPKCWNSLTGKPGSVLFPRQFRMWKCLGCEGLVPWNDVARAPLPSWRGCSLTLGNESTHFKKWTCPFFLLVFRRSTCCSWLMMSMWEQPSERHRPFLSCPRLFLVGCGLTPNTVTVEELKEVSIPLAWKNNSVHVWIASYFIP